MGISEANAWQRRFLGIRYADEGLERTLEDEIAAGLRSSPQRVLPAKLLYDEVGSALFDRICDTPEYYPTRTELALLERVGERIAAQTRARTVIELGSGLSRKTDVLLQAYDAYQRSLRYVLVDVSESALVHSAELLLRRFPALSIEAVVGDFSRPSRVDGDDPVDHAPSLLPVEGRTLVAFLGGTIGNFEQMEAVALLAGVRAQLDEGDHLLLGADLAKNPRVIHAAYNDADGLTESFNRNVMDRLRRELKFELDPRRFRHEAFFDRRRSRVEMHLRAMSATRLRCDRMGLQVNLAAGESIRTEISRKFTIDEVSQLISDAGFSLVELFVGDPPYALALARVRVDA